MNLPDNCYLLKMLFPKSSFPHVSIDFVLKMFISRLDCCQLMSVGTIPHFNLEYLNEHKHYCPASIASWDEIHDDGSKLTADTLREYLKLFHCHLFDFINDTFLYPPSEEQYLKMIDEYVSSLDDEANIPDVLRNGILIDKVSYLFSLELDIITGKLREFMRSADKAADELQEALSLPEAEETLQAIFDGQ